MTPDRWKQIEQLFHQAAELSQDQRSIFLNKACDNDFELIREVETLLLQDDQTGAILKTIISQAADSLSFEEVADLTGMRIGAYRIIGLIGQGGMAEVYKAVRDDDQYQKQVAIKLIRRNNVSFLVSRFWHERQILARLEHPCIARFLEGGTTKDGIPYLVMEFIDGEPITEYCDKHDLNIRKRLELFRSVCDAVQYAHRNLVIHRDLKPSNILITSEGVPKLLDFGIAKLLNPEGASEFPTATVTSIRLMTPEYASPEQVRGAQITTATDVYSLGVVLYELLTRERAHQFKTKSFLEIERVICEQEPERPSSAVMRTRSEVGINSDEKKKLSREFARELDNILLMAMQKDPHHRYHTVAQFADDIQRYLDGLPVLAKTQTIGYRAIKFARRHRMAVTLAALFVLMLSAFATVMTMQASRIAKERDRANQVTSFLVNLFEVSNPSESRGSNVTARELLNTSVQKIERDLKEQPEVQAAMMDTMGRVYANLGLYNTATPLLKKSLEIRKEILGEDNSDVASTMSSLAETLYKVGEYNDAEPIAKKALAIRRNLLGNEHPDVAASLSSLGGGLYASGKYDEAESVLREALIIRQKFFGSEHMKVATSLNQLGLVLAMKGKRVEEESLYRRALAIRRKLLGNNHPDVASSLNNLGRVLLDKADYQAAEVLLREAVDLDRKILGNDHPDLAVTMSSLAWTLKEKGEYPEAEKLLRSAVALRRKALGNNHPDLAMTICRLGVFLVEKGEYVEALPLLTEAQLIWKKALPPTHSNHAHVLVAFGRLRKAMGNYMEAEEFFAKAMEIRTRELPPGHTVTAVSKGLLGESLTLQGRYSRAEPLLLDSYRTLLAKRVAHHPETTEAAERLISLYKAWGKPAEALKYQTK